ncbi:hypothetical protein M409DRAFT_22760 [Zasmidium cellare ATCC 36951]|uniref:Antigenic cell wall galactomannoprotein n=1 Tax=Zasmidium cellare ATCC 36951 TaxID=1080233 RepID=A0A6A6CHM5_ZASCE|nr:uncharacterized protein M409DRAFT_22760 [Zasmidium cellare ATCC 36951]KAF2166704.1 hypothetical protein M409DRAFT_22760 [Zasmidium cellare ATCC 36951]
MKFFIPVVGLMATSALAQGVEQPIVDAITVIQARTQRVDTDVLAWSGDRRGFRPIFFDSQKLLKSINNGTNVANANESLDFNGAVNVGLATLNLIPVVNQTLIDFIATIPKFNKLYLTPTVLDSLNQQKAASDAFSAAVIAKVPDGLKDLAGQVTAPIDEDFDVSIAAFQAAVDSLPKWPHHPKGWTGWGWRWGKGWGWY